MPAPSEQAAEDIITEETVAASAAGDFVERLYIECMGRRSDALGFNNWYGMLKNQTASSWDVARGFAGSLEFGSITENNNAECVKRLYRAMLDRECNATELNTWLAELNKGTTPEQIAEGIAKTTEFKNLCASWGIYWGFEDSNAPTATPGAPTAAPSTPAATPVPVKGDPVKTGAFTDRLYEVCLNRTANANGKNDWVNQMTSFQTSGTKAAYGFIFSPEFQKKGYSNEDYVEHLYAAFMGRASDAGGKAGWVNLLKAGTSREEVFYGFANSKEFDGICNSYGIVSKDIETFVTRFYSVCLGRKPDAAGLADWSARLRGKTSTGRDIAFGFIFSKEFTGKNYSNEDYVEHLYAAFMGRASDAAGKTGWVNLLKSGKSRQEVFEGFVGSQEFSAICASYDINRG